ncbi:MAG: SDR family oxidoreductase [Gammaproteobacteria bacterium]
MEDKPDKAVLIIGCGYIGRRIARLLPTDTYRVTGCVRSDESAAALSAAGIEVLQADLDAGFTPAAVSGFDELYYLAPPPPSGDVDTRMATVLPALDSRRLRRIVYISTSAVYGDCRGAWITEAQALAPTSGRGRRRLDAEQQLQDWCKRQGVQCTVLRVPGIYGPGKLPLARLEQGLPVLHEADAPYTNRIHGDDLAMICVTAMQSPVSNTVFNVSDGHPSNMTDYFFRVADAAGLPRPPTVTRAEAEQVLSPGMLSFLADSRRMKNDKLVDQLGVSLKYPDLAAGLAGCFRD